MFFINELAAHTNIETAVCTCRVRGRRSSCKNCLRQNDLGRLLPRMAGLFPSWPAGEPLGADWYKSQLKKNWSRCLCSWPSREHMCSCVLLTSMTVKSMTRVYFYQVVQVVQHTTKRRESYCTTNFGRHCCALCLVCAARATQYYWSRTDSTVQK